MYTHPCFIFSPVYQTNVIYVFMILWIEIIYNFSIETLHLLIRQNQSIQFRQKLNTDGPVCLLYLTQIEILDDTPFLKVKNAENLILKVITVGKLYRLHYHGIELWNYPQ